MTPSGTVSTYQQLHDSFTYTSEEEATTATSSPDIAPAAIFQSIYSLPHQHNTGCSLLDSTCECILDNSSFHLIRDYLPVQYHKGVYKTLCFMICAWCHQLLESYKGLCIYTNVLP